MFQHYHLLPDSYFLKSFIGRIRSNVKPLVRAFKQNYVSDVIEYARYQEESIEANKSFRILLIPLLTLNQPIQTCKHKLTSFITHSSKSPKYNQTFSRPQINLSPGEKRERQLKGLCFLCAKPYDRNPKCKLKETRLSIVEIQGSDESSFDEGGTKKYCMKRWCMLLKWNLIF